MVLSTTGSTSGFCLFHFEPLDTDTPCPFIATPPQQQQHKYALCEDLLCCKKGKELSKASYSAIQYTKNKDFIYIIMQKCRKVFLYRIIIVGGISTFPENSYALSFYNFRLKKKQGSKSLQAPEEVYWLTPLPQWNLMDESAPPSPQLFHSSEWGSYSSHKSTK